MRAPAARVEHDREADRPPRGRRNLLQGPVGWTLLRLAAPMVLGIGAIILFNVVDTFYVGRLGARPLAAMSFTFPVSYFVMSVAMGIGVGVTSVISRAVGADDQERVRCLATDGLILANTLVVGVAIVGLVSIDRLFRMLGAPPDLIPLIRDYMVLWYAGVGLLVIPMLGNSAIRGLGDTRTPALIMMVAGGVNVVLDPLLIFGIGPFPRLELRGAALATVISWSVTFVAAFWILARRERVLIFELPGLSRLRGTWGAILHVGLPAAATAVLLPLAGGVVTRFVAAHGTVAVAAYGVGTRMESLALVGLMALSAATTPFAGQNAGAGHWGRVRQALGLGARFSLCYGLAAAGLLAAGSRPLAALFNEQPAVIELVTSYLWILPLSYGLLGCALLVSAIFNAAGRPYRSAGLNLTRLFVLAVPLAWLGSRWGGVVGLFVGVTLANLLAGLAALALGYWSLADDARRLRPVEETGRDSLPRAERST